MHNPASPKAAPAKPPRPPRPDYPHQAAMWPNYPDLDISSWTDNQITLDGLDGRVQPPKRVVFEQPTTNEPACPTAACPRADYCLWKGTGCAMRSRILLLAVLLAVGLTFGEVGPTNADEPPSCEGFSKRSANGRFLAVVEGGGAAALPPCHCVVTVYESQQAGPRVWSAPCLHRQYDYAAVVSDDGKSFIWLDHWFAEDFSMIDFDYEGRLVNRVTGREIPFDRKALFRTTTHVHWLANYRIEGGCLIVRTRDGHLHRFDVTLGSASTATCTP